MKEQLNIAVPLAIEYHGDQKYGDSEKPYVYHLASVDKLVISAYVPKDLDHSEQYSKEPGDEIDLVRSLAYLHDVKEDTHITHITDKIMLDAGLCQELVDAVTAISKVKDESYPDYLRKVMANPLALKVKIADTATNLAHSIFAQNERRIEKYMSQLNILKGFEQP